MELNLPIWKDSPETPITAESLNAIVEAIKLSFEEIKKINDNRSDVGDIICSSTLDTMEKVIERYGGTLWEQIKGKFLLGADENYPVGTTGGKTKYTLSAAIGAVDSNTSSLGYIAGSPTAYQQNNKPSFVVYGGSASGGGNSSWNHSTAVTEAGVNDRNVNIMPPYIAKYIWHRVE